MIGHVLYGMSISEDLNEPNNFKDVLLKTVSRWKIKASPVHGKSVFFQVFNGWYGDLIFSSSSIDKKDAEFSFGWGGENSVIKPKKSLGNKFIKTIMYAVKGYQSINGTDTMMEHEIVVEGPVSLDNLVGISERVYKNLIQNKKLSNVKKILKSIDQKKIVVIMEDEYDSELED